ncbi:MAG TPA: TIGR01777 family oxidoreductase [Fimbriimonadaceae bacterium]
MKKGKIVLAGGAGYIGKELARQFAEEYDVVILSRHSDANSVTWDGKTLGPWQKELDGAAAVINLSGESVAKHWSDANKLSILESRIFSTRVIGEAIQASAKPPTVWINSSAIGYYGDRGSEELTESSEPGAKGQFLVDVCVAWEEEQVRAVTPGTRKVRLRTGVVLGKGSSAFEPLRKATTYFVGGSIGNGRQYMSWIHVNDLAAMFRWAFENEVEGPVNGTAPQPATNEELMAMMRAVLRRPWAPPIPAFVLKLVTMLGGPEASLLLDSERVLPKAVVGKGFEFKFGGLREAIADLLLGG